MASVYKRENGKYAIRYLDEAGKWRSKVTSARTKREAQRLAHEKSQRCERVRLGLERSLSAGTEMTLGELMRWWLEHHSVHMKSHSTNVGMVKKHLASHSLAQARANRVGSGPIFQFLTSLRPVLSAKSVNNFRGYLHVAYEAALQSEVLACKNPVTSVKRLRVPKRVYEFLRPGV